MYFWFLEISIVGFYILGIRITGNYILKSEFPEPVNSCFGLCQNSVYMFLIFMNYIFMFW